MASAPIEDVAKTLREAAQDPFRFDDLVDKWNAVFDQEDAVDPIDAQLSDAVDETFHVIADEGAIDAVEPRLRQILNTLPHSAFVVRSDGIVAAMNEAAIARLPFDPGDPVDNLVYALDRGEALSDAIRAALDRRNSSEVLMRRAVHVETDRSATIAIVATSDSNEKRALVFVIDPQWRKEVETLLGRAFELTDAETGVLMTFLDGHGLKEIARQRGTSHATVRTQFQTIMSKTGSRTQAELMRNTIAVSQFFTDIGQVADVARHPNRRRFDMLRAGGRSVDVTLAGDLSGKLVIAIAEGTLFTHPAQVEQAFKDAGICMVSICRPGFGRTDPADSERDYLECFAEDVLALADQLGQQKFVLMGHNMSSVYAYGLASILAPRLHSLFVKSTLVPAPYLDAQRVRSPWAKALMRGVNGSSRMYKIMVYSAIRAWKVMGSRRMLLMQLRGYQPDEDLAKQPFVYNEYDAAMKMSQAQGPEHAVRSFLFAKEDWSHWVSECPVPIHVVQGQHDPSSDPATVTDFANRHSEQITLHRIPNAGYLTFITHTRTMIDLLECAFAVR